MKQILLLFISFNLSLSYAQDVSCDDLQNFIQTKGYYKSSLSNFSLNSEWLYEVKAYTYEYTIYVIAKIKPNPYSFNTKAYVFCGIPSQNWSNFQYGGYGDSNSYGERFHKYIFDYRCNCY
ncbi:hypothetical protein NA63_2589 [Flavobacteriaceae bacterium MAR_2010_105]|nr:hypothetical protein NA63_2589 [Flavobacteriaceae bacterium MAR_2010_105]